MKCKKCGGEPSVWHYSWLSKWYADCQMGKCQRHVSTSKEGVVALWEKANAKPRRRAKPFRRWSRDRFGCWAFDGEYVEASVVENLLNAKHVVLPENVRR